MDDNTDLESPLIASRNSGQESRRRRRTNSSRNRTSGERYPAARLQSPENFQEDSDPYFGTLTPRQLSQVTVERPRPSANSIGKLPSRARLEDLQPHRPLNPCAGEDCPVRFPAPAFCRSPDLPQPLTEPFHVTLGKTLNKEKNRLLQRQSKPEQQRKGSSFFARFRKLGGASVSRSKESPTAPSPLYNPLVARNEETERRLPPNPLRNGWKRGFSSEALGTQSAQKPGAGQKGERPLSLAAKFGGREGHCSLGEQENFLGRGEELPLGELGRLPIKKELQTFDRSLTPPIARKSSRRYTVCVAFACSLQFILLSAMNFGVPQPF
jgi:hypothetical protein